MTDQIMLDIKKKCNKKRVIEGFEGCTYWNYGRCKFPQKVCVLKTYCS